MPGKGEEKVMKRGATMEEQGKCKQPRRVSTLMTKTLKRKG